MLRVRLGNETCSFEGEFVGKIRPSLAELELARLGDGVLPLA